ncbi:MAG: GNAT family N-acetyltransferase [Candidatus Heimdallarchaeota archaeon]|nr:GNAT family N-acetyltransferase [Candidatus Heimdallarchaeota archaeon]
MRHYKKLIGEKCYLSPISNQDAEQWSIWFNDLEVTIPLGDEAYIPTSASNEQKAINDILQNNAHVFSIVDLTSDELIGRILLFDIDKINRNAMLGIVIGEKSYWNKGYGQDSLKLLLDYGFNLLNLNNIMLGVFSYNEGAINCYKKVGFKEIGRRRQAKIIAGKKFDIVLMDILAQEFKSIYISKYLP